MKFSNLREYDAVQTSLGWHLPDDLPQTGDLLVHVDRQRGDHSDPRPINGRSLARIEGKWYVHWEGFDWRPADANYM